MVTLGANFNAEQPERDLQDSSNFVDQIKFIILQTSRWWGKKPILEEKLFIPSNYLSKKYPTGTSINITIKPKQPELFLYCWVCCSLESSHCLWHASQKSFLWFRHTARVRFVCKDWHPHFTQLKTLGSGPDRRSNLFNDNKAITINRSPIISPKDIWIPFLILVFHSHFNKNKPDIKCMSLIANNLKLNWHVILRRPKLTRNAA